MDIFSKIIYFNFVMDAQKSRYYLGFKFPEAGAIASGLGYQGTTTVGGKAVESFDRLCNLKTRFTEFGLTPKD